MTTGGQGDSFEHFPFMNVFMPPEVHVFFKIYVTTLTSVRCTTFILPRKGQRGEVLNGRWMDTAGGYCIPPESQLLFA